MATISVIIPVYNTVIYLPRCMKSVLGQTHNDLEIILIDDGSTDGSHQIAKTLSPLTYIRLRKNFGQTAAMDAGIKAAKYPFIVTMDGDRQNDPKDIPM
ncbi:MAG TPA: glycosyltransferase, partial [Coriobacteriia bacterium]|nr:glycosyltransferase [Coriobacteriia bacterium]